FDPELAVLIRHSVGDVAHHGATVCHPVTDQNADHGPAGLRVNHAARGGKDFPAPGHSDVDTRGFLARFDFDYRGLRLIGGVGIVSQLIAARCRTEGSESAEPAGASRSSAGPSATRPAATRAAILRAGLRAALTAIRCCPLATILLNTILYDILAAVATPASSDTDQIPSGRQAVDAIDAAIIGGEIHVGRGRRL